MQAQQHNQQYKLQLLQQQLDAIAADWQQWLSQIVQSQQNQTRGDDNE